MVFQLNDGTSLPAIGFGTFPLGEGGGVDAMVNALHAGYRLLDSAVNYKNEEYVGEAIRTSGVPRDEILVTTKIPGRHHAYDDARQSIRESLQRLGVDHTDLHLIHWPNPQRGQYVEAWRALIDAQQEGLVRSIGVSNFTETHLGTIIDETGVTPAVNQIELHPHFPQPEMRAVHERLGIVTQAWSPLGKRTAPFSDPAVAGPAEKYDVTPGQVIVRWHVELGTLPIPKSADPERQRTNLDVDGFALSADEVEAITALAKSDGRWFGADPETHEEL